jgi:hypothetical protein
MLKQFVVRLAPLTHSPIIVDANSLDAGRLKAVVNGKDETVIGIDYFRASEPADLTVAHKIVMEYAKRNNIPETDVMVRARLPKSFSSKQRKTQDANLVLVKNDDEQTKKEAKTKEQDYRSKVEREADELAVAAQAMQDSHDKQERKKATDDAVKPLEALAKEYKQAPAKEASVANPEGATVKRTDGEKQRAKRPYNKTSEKERSAKSRAAYERYVKELEKTAAKSPTIMEPVKPGPGVSQETVDAETMKLAMALARILKATGAV